ncbi:MAG: lipocalin family protein [Ignavibacteriales bacterium]
MKIIIFSIFILITIAITVPGQDMSKEPETVKLVDLKRYAGLWYEIAKIPNRFQKDCVKGTTAEYKLRDDGKITVINSCTEQDGSRKSTEGVAKVVDPATNSKLEVSFFSILGIRPFWGDYWIIGLDDNYEFAVIGDPKRKYGWILSRTPRLPEEKLKTALEILKQRGYNPENFEFTDQKK